MYLNQVILIGRIVRNPEVKKMPNGTSVASVSIATSRTYVDKTTNKKVEDAEFHNAVAFGKTAEIMGQYLTKGQLVNIVGRLKTRSWENKDDGKKMYRTEIIVETMQMGPRAGGEKQEENGDPSETPVDYPEENQGGEPEDEIPF